MKKELKPLWEYSDRKKVIVISDLHLDVNDDYTEINANRELLVEFLNV